jgi:hypothetical protein
VYMKEKWTPPSGYEGIAKQPPEYNPYAKNYEQFTEEQTELAQELAKVDQDIKTLRIMYRSALESPHGEGGIFGGKGIYGHKSEVANRRNKLHQEVYGYLPTDSYQTRLAVEIIKGRSPESVKEDKRKMSEFDEQAEIDLAESHDFYSEGKADMFSDGWTQPDFEPKVYGRKMEDLDSSTRSLVEYLEKMGFTYEYVMEILKEELELIREFYETQTDSVAGPVTKNEGTAMYRVLGRLLLELQKKRESIRAEFLDSGAQAFWE